MNREAGKRALMAAGQSEKKAGKLEKQLYENCKSEDYEWVIYQKVGEILQGKDEEKKNVSPPVVSSPPTVGWHAACYDRVRRKLAEFDEYLDKPFEVENGVVECSCGSKKTYSFTKQCRGADEPATTFSKCVECGKNWTYSG